MVRATRELQMRDLLGGAKAQLAEATGLEPVAVHRAFRDGQGWHVRLEMLEMRRIPSATDVLGDYEAILDEEGSLMQFERVGGRLRGETADGA